MSFVSRDMQERLLTVNWKERAGYNSSNAHDLYSEYTLSKLGRSISYID